MIEIARNIQLNEAELQFSFIRSPGPGGQNVNKVATAVLLRFDVKNSPSLPDEVKTRLSTLTKLTLQGELIIKASRFRTQERNKQDALGRLLLLLKQAATPPKKRRKTKPTFASKQKRLTSKKLLGKTKSLRNKKMSNDH
ncbi:MAG: alternative ribosome rescue aminoacyl-tRNA hydrolase ArfB [Gammaproteobacteria bacterium]|nr:alternative ribosome rescue aminoacyl-tRNA hydrolase ArfB [Gammaproteobacteria bacterium]